MLDRPETEDRSMVEQPSSPWPRRLVIFGLVLGPVMLIAATISEPTAENLTFLLAIPGSGLYTLVLYLMRRWWLPLLARRPLRNAMLFGIANAAVIETLFWAAERLMGAKGVAASDNLLLDLVMTMPWYIGMVIIFVRVQNRRRFPAAVVLLLGAVYEAGADGVVGGQVMPLLMGEPIDLLGSWVFLALAMFWEFIPVYSSMVLPPAWLIDKAPAAPPSSSAAWLDALKPLLWLLPFSVYLLALLVIIALVSK